MRVTGTGRVGSTQKSKSSNATSKSGSSFAIPEKTQETSSATGVAANSPIASVEAIVALQGVDSDSKKNTRQIVEIGEEMLDRLDQIRHGLLMGEIPVSGLLQLKKTLANFESSSDDPKLSEIIEEIEVRAAVELAKLGY